jgi:F-type H+-transporting ATPase subunit delta
MKRDKKITKLAKKLVELSKDDSGIVTEAKVGEVLAGLKQVELRQPQATLKAYLGYVRREVALQTAVVSTPADLSAAALSQIAAKFTALYGRPISAETKQDPSLIAGVRVRVGDDVYDASVAGRLQRLAENVR